MRVKEVNTEAAFIELGTALDLSEEQKKQLSIEAMQWHCKYMEKIADLQEMNERLQEVQAGREIARGQAKIREVKKEYVEDKAAESSTMAEQLAAANQRVRLLEVKSQETIAQLANTAELEERLEESLVRITELEAQLSSRSGEEGGGDAGRERDRERGNRETTQSSTTTQQAPTSVESESEQARLVKSQADIIANQRSTLKRIMADIHRELQPDSEAPIDSTHTNDANERAASQFSTPDIPLSDDMSRQQPDPETGDSAVSHFEESRESSLDIMTATDVYNILRKQYGPHARIEITTVHDSEPITAGGVGGENVGAEGGRGGLIIDGYPVRGIPGFSKTTKHTLEPTPIQVATMVDLQSEYAQLQQRHDDLQKQHSAVLESEEAIRKDNHENHLHYLGLLTAASERLERIWEAVYELRSQIIDREPEDKDLISLVKRSEDVIHSYNVAPYRRLLESPQREAEDLGRKHLFHHERMKDRTHEEILAECNRAYLILHSFSVRCRRLFSRVLRVLPSGRDQTIFPATWAWLDQEFEKTLSSYITTNQSEIPPNIPFLLRGSAHGLWPEVTLTAFSWAFYKLLDSVWEDETSSHGMGKVMLRSVICLAAIDLPQAMRDRYRIVGWNPT